VFTGSGSEAVESALKVALQFFDCARQAVEEALIAREALVHGKYAGRAVAVWNGGTTAPVRGESARCVVSSRPRMPIGCLRGSRSRISSAIWRMNWSHGFKALERTGWRDSSSSPSSGAAGGVVAGTAGIRRGRPCRLRSSRRAA